MSSDPVRVILHVDGIHDHHGRDLHLLDEPLDLPDDLVSSYRVIPLDAATAARVDAMTDSRTRWLELLNHVVPYRLDSPSWRPALPGSGASGMLVMPGSPERPGWRDDDPVTWGRTTLDGRTLWLSGDDGADHLLVLSDGARWSQLPLPAALQRLAAEGRLPRLKVVAVDTAEDRVALLSRSAEYRTLIADRILPELRGGIPAEWTVVSGESLGGLAALDVVLRRPDAVRLAVVTSGSFWLGDTAAEIRKAGAPDVRVHLSAGRGEGRDMDGHARAVAEALRGAGVPATLDVGTWGHETAGWTGALTRGLVELLG